MRSKRSKTAIAGVTLALTLSACGSDSATLDAAGEPQTSTSTIPVEVTVRTAEEGEAARARLAALRPETLSSATTATGIAEADADASDMTSSDVNLDGEPAVLPVDPCGDLALYEPTPEDIAAANIDTEGLAEALDAAGITYTRTTDDFGFLSIDYDWEDPDARAAADAYWFERYPPEPIEPVELERNRQENDVIAAKLDAAGVEYIRTTGLDGWEMLDLADWNDPVAQAAIEAAYDELYPPQSPSIEELDWMREENDRLSEALTNVGVEHTWVRDELGYEWIEWDFEDEATNALVMEAFDELYPVDLAIDPAVSEIVDPIPAPVDVDTDDIDIACE